jgi:hypothetical protein
MRKGMHVSIINFSWLDYSTAYRHTARETELEKKAVKLFLAVLSSVLLCFDDPFLTDLGIPANLCICSKHGVFGLATD